MLERILKLKVSTPTSCTVAIQENKQDELLTCKNDCRFFKDNQCIKEDVVINYYGYDKDEFHAYFKKHQNANADECLTFEAKESFKVIEFNGKIVKVEICSRDEIKCMGYSISYLAYLVHLFGIESFSGMELLEDDVMKQIQVNLG